MELTSLSDWLNAAFEVLNRAGLMVPLQALVLLSVAATAYKLLVGRRE